MASVHWSEHCARRPPNRWDVLTQHWRSNPPFPQKKNPPTTRFLVVSQAPEVERCPIKLLPHDNKHDASLAYTTAADIWSVGVLAFEMLCGFPPLSSANPYNEQQQQQGLPAGESPLRFPAFVSPGARDFIATCLAERPGDRPTAAQLLRHPWLKATLAAAARTSHTCQRHDST